MTNNPIQGYYCVVQYCPDLSRFESVNIGVLLFCPSVGYLRAITTQNNTRIRRFFGSDGHDWTRVSAMKVGFQERLALEARDIHNVDDLKHFIAMRANLLQITQPLPMRVEDPDKDLLRLYTELLGALPRRTSTKKLQKIIEERLDQAGLESKVRRDIEVAVPVLQKTVHVPFGFQNGRFNLMTPVRFESADPEKAVVTACKYAVEGRSIYDNRDPRWGDQQLLVIGQFRSQSSESATRVQRVFDENHVRLFRMDDLSRLVSEIRHTGKDISDDTNHN